VPTRPYFVMPDGVCVPLEGDWRIAELRGEWYVLGHDSVVPCGSRSAAASMLAELESGADVDRLASEAIEGLESRPLSIRGERVDRL
jgi:type II secretory pathway component PulL